MRDHRKRWRLFFFLVLPLALAARAIYGVWKEIEPDSVELFRFDLIACAHRFPAGHRVRLVVCASGPLYVLPSLTPSFYRLFHTAEQSSGITLPVMEVSAR